MANSTVLSIPQVAAGQSQKEVTMNDAVSFLEQAMSRKASIDLTAGNVTLTETQITRNVLLRFSGHTVPRTVTIPATMTSNSQPTQRFFAVQNDGTSTGTVTIGGPSGTSVTIQIASTAVIFYDGSNAVAMNAAASTGVYQLLSEKGNANGYASLDGTGKVPSSQLPSAVTGTLAFQGSWDANANTPTITSSVGTLGYYYIVGTAGTTTIDGISSWAIGDQIVFDGTVWKKIDNSVGNENTANKNVANGYAGLDSNAKVPWTRLPTEAQQIILGGYFPGRYSAGQQLWRMKAVFDFTIAANIAGSTANVDTADRPAASAAVTIKKNGTTAATITFGTGSDDATFSTQAQISVAAGDIVTIVAPATADANLGNMAIAILGLKV